MSQSPSTSKTKLQETTEIKNGVPYTKYPENSKLKGTPIIDISKATEIKPTIEDFFDLYALDAISEDTLNRAIFEL